MFSKENVHLDGQNKEKTTGLVLGFVDVAGTGPAPGSPAFVIALELTDQPVVAEALVQIASSAACLVSLGGVAPDIVANPRRRNALTSPDHHPVAVDCCRSWMAANSLADCDLKNWTWGALLIEKLIFRCIFEYNGVRPWLLRRELHKCRSRASFPIQV